MAFHKNGTLQKSHIKIHVIGFLKYYQYAANRNYL